MVTITVTDDVTQVKLSETDTAHRADTDNPHEVTAAQVGAPTTATFNDHSARHENGGADEISVAGLSGELADAQTPKAHDLAGAEHNATTLAALNLKISDATLDSSSGSRTPTAHDLAGALHNSATLAGLNAKISDATLDDSGDSRPPTAHAIGGALHNASTLAELNTKVSDATLDDSSDPRDPNAHAISHQNGGTDEISVAGLSGLLADSQTPLAHDLAGALHNSATLAEINAKISDDDLVGLAASQTLTNKTLTSPALSGPTVTGDLVVSGGGSVFINESANSQITTGLTINQGANDDYILALKSSDVNHGVTGVAETDTYLQVRKNSGTAGGVSIEVLAEDDPGTDNPLTFLSIGGTPSTSKAASSRGLASYTIYQHDGAGNLTGIDADGNIFSIRAYNGSAVQTKFLVDIDGDIWTPGHLALNGVTPAAQATGYTTFGNLATDRTLDADSTTLAEVADVLGTLIEDLKATGIIGA